MREAVTLALNDAKLDLDGIEAVVYSLSPDAMVGIGNAERLGVDAVGARNKRFLRINTGGATGISSVAAAYYHVAAGACDVVLTAGADKVGECGDSQTVLNKIWDPTYERQLPLGTINMLAMSAVRYMDKYGMTEEDMARVVVKNRWHASKNPHAHLRKQTTVEEVFRSRYISWPIKLFDCCPQSSGGGAMVLASERYIKERNLDAVWITGVGHCSETYYIGDRMGERLHRRPRRRLRAGQLVQPVATRWPGSPTRASRSTSPSCTRRSATPSSTRSRRPGWRTSAQSPAMMREGQFQIGRRHPGQPVRRRAVHQRDRGDRDDPRRGSRAAGLGPRRRASGEGRQASASPAATAATTSSSEPWWSRPSFPKP